MSALVQYEPFVDSTTELYLAQTEKIFADANQSCDFARWLQFYAFDVIGEMTYSKRHGFVEQNKDVDGIVKYLGKIFNYVAPVCTARFPIASRLTITDWPNAPPRPPLPQEPHLPETLTMGLGKLNIHCRQVSKSAYG